MNIEQLLLQESIKGKQELIGLYNLWIQLGTSEVETEYLKGHIERLEGEIVLLQEDK